MVPRVFTPTVPALSLARWARTDRCRISGLTGIWKTSSERVISPTSCISCEYIVTVAILCPLLHLSENHDPFLGPGNLAANNHDVIFRPDIHDFRVLTGHGLVSHLAGHFLAFENLGRPCALTDGPGHSVHLFMAVGCGHPGEIPSAHDSGKTSTLGGSGH